jgi:hypothetical protein
MALKKWREKGESLRVDRYLCIEGRCLHLTHQTCHILKIMSAKTKVTKTMHRARTPPAMGSGDGGASPSPPNRGRGRGRVPDSGQAGDGDGDGGASPPPGKSGRTPRRPRPRPRTNRGRERGRGRGRGCPRPAAEGADPAWPSVRALFRRQRRMAPHQPTAGWS